ncbi:MULTISPECIES: hypothetical protein [unclassified Fusobacterium]|uniref:hypothetical protein n=1 Tax=unclassified Fusobacterium TaxID=2648384 RepID=UPI001B8D02C5|nr:MULTISPECIES: hypothetical protein [unclassified Fusobacterium]MBR8701047.1 hypothetical protein [Fusobacterium sp. DD45]MBR8710819.1 hypothetical protein [Fusobacterium sp. DD28]MBR8751403.1 hypothetical protein [Fusobacterium sp. DD26]
MEFLGNEIIKVKDNYKTGLTTYQIDDFVVTQLKDFYYEVLKKDFEPKEIIRDFKQKDYSIEFKTTGQYLDIERSLIGGSGTGNLENLCKNYYLYNLAGEKKQTEYQKMLKNNMNKIIDMMNNNSVDIKKFGKIQKFKNTIEIPRKIKSKNENER